MISSLCLWYSMDNRRPSTPLRGWIGRWERPGACRASDIDECGGQQVGGDTRRLPVGTLQIILGQSPHTGDPIIRGVVHAVVRVVVVSEDLGCGR